MIQNNQQGSSDIERPTGTWKRQVDIGLRQNRKI